jgi:hypothetical protein
MRIGDVSRSRRFADPVRQRWYAFHRAIRFARRMRQATRRPEQIVQTSALRYEIAGKPGFILDSALCFQARLEWIGNHRGRGQRAGAPGPRLALFKPAFTPGCLSL